MRTAAVTFLMLVSSLAWGGCSPQGDALPTATVPVCIESDGHSWLHQGAPSADETNALKQCFARNPSIVDNPDLRGRPEVYTGPKGARRFYWFQSTPSGQRSTYLQIDARGRLESTGETAESDLR